ncbi:unnamed protein product [Gordionus sp. m RMFG-2023]
MFINNCILSIIFTASVLRITYSVANQTQLQLQSNSIPTNSALYCIKKNLTTQLKPLKSKIIDKITTSSLVNKPRVNINRTKISKPSTVAPLRSKILGMSNRIKKISLIKDNINTRKIRTPRVSKKKRHNGPVLTKHSILNRMIDSELKKTLPKLYKRKKLYHWAAKRSMLPSYIHLL